MQISNTLSLDKEVVLTERRATNEFRITEVYESIVNRFVRVEVEFGPFTSDESFGGRVMIKAEGGRRSIVAWDNADYDAIRDTWTNADLLEVVKLKLTS